MNELSIEFLPCPFCGSAVQMSELDDEDEGRMWVRYIECETCEVKMREWAGWNIPWNRQYISDQVEKALAAKWNRRDFRSNPE